jgi:hypothetical protein
MLFIGKIRMRFAAGGAPVAVMRKILEPVNKVNILLVLLDRKLQFLYYTRKFSNIIKMPVFH